MTLLPRVKLHSCAWPVALCAIATAWAAETPDEFAYRKRLEKTKHEIEDMIRSWADAENIEVEVAKRQVLVHGRVKRRRHAERINKALGYYPSAVSCIKMPSPAEEVAADIEKVLPLGVQAQPAGGAVLLVGSVSDQKDLDLSNLMAEQELAVAGQRVKVVSHVVLLEPSHRPRVEVAFYFAELTKTDLDTMGVEWAEQMPLTLSGTLSYDSAGGGGPFTRLAGVFTGQASTSFDTLIHAIRRDGRIRIHDEYRTTVDAGDKATYERKGIIYIPVSGVEAVDLKEVEYGTSLEVTPVVRRADRVQAVIKAKVSALDEPVGGQITVMQERCSTTIDLTTNQVIAIWRVVQRNSRITERRVPGLAKVPALGRLFQSSDFEQGKTESALFIHVRLGREPDVFDQIMHKLKEWPTN